MTPTAPPKPQPPTGLKNLFFIRRRPRIKEGFRANPPSEWKRPLNEQEYQELLDDADFISIPKWAEEMQLDLRPYPVIIQDLSDLDQHLLPVFFDFSQRAKYYQNRFYLFQWIFVVGAFTTTVLAALSASTVIESVIPSNVLNLITAVVGSITTALTAWSARDNPQKQWAKCRRATEVLRMQYFKYLAHTAPYHQPDRLSKMRANVLQTQTEVEKNE